MRVLPAGLFLIATLWCGPALSEVKVIEAESASVIKDRDTGDRARKIALLDAKSKALEQAVMFIEGLALTTDQHLSKDEVKAYTAATLETDLMLEQTPGPTGPREVVIKIRCKLDTDRLAARIGQYRENEDLLEQLLAAVKEADRLKTERDALVKQLDAQQGKAAAEGTMKKLNAVLLKEGSLDETNRVWSALTIQFDQSESKGTNTAMESLNAPAAVLERAVNDHPQNQRARYLLAAIAMKQGDLSSAERHLNTAIHQLPSSPAPHLKLGALLREQGKYMEAMKQYHFVERLRPKYLPVVFYTGMTFKDMNRCGKAVQYLNRFLKDPRISAYPGKKELAAAAIQECGGERPGRQKRTKQQKNAPL